MAVTAPVIHLNGTSKQTLTDGYAEALGYARMLLLRFPTNRELKALVIAVLNEKGVDVKKMQLDHYLLIDQVVVPAMCNLMEGLSTDKKEDVNTMWERFEARADSIAEQLALAITGIVNCGLPPKPVERPKVLDAVDIRSLRETITTELMAIEAMAADEEVDSISLSNSVEAVSMHVQTLLNEIDRLDKVIEDAWSIATELEAHSFNDKFYKEYSRKLGNLLQLRNDAEVAARLDAIREDG